MKRRETNRTSRLLEPGEIDGLIAVDRMVRAPRRHADESLLAPIFDKYAGTGAQIPDGAFCDVPKWDFLDYAVRRGMLLVGSRRSDLTDLEPLVLSQNLNGWNRPRLFAFAEATSPMFHAIVDRDRLRDLRLASNTIVVQDVACYYGLDYRALPHGPWRRGTVYLYDQADLPSDFLAVPYRDPLAIRPRARVDVEPWDWPLLGQVAGLDPEVQGDRQTESYAGYPWPDDADVHPHLPKRCLAVEARRYLDAHFDEPVDLVQLGRRVGLSPFAILRNFRAVVGLSPHDYQALARVRWSKSRLREGAMIGSVAVESGFCDQSHFSRHFRRIVCLTPGRYVRAQESPILPA